MHTVQFSSYILVWVLVWAPAWSIYWLNTGGKAAILAFSNFNGYSARENLVVSRSCSKRSRKKEVENIIAGWSSSVISRSDGLMRDRGPDGRNKRGRGLTVFAIPPSQRLNLAISLWSTTLYSTFVASIAHHQPSPPWFCKVRTFSAELCPVSQH